jgi:hypothetical protein
MVASANVPMPSGSPAAEPPGMTPSNQPPATPFAKCFPTAAPPPDVGVSDRPCQTVSGNIIHLVLPSVCTCFGMQVNGMPTGESSVGHWSPALLLQEVDFRSLIASQPNFGEGSGYAVYKAAGKL